MAALLGLDLEKISPFGLWKNSENHNEENAEVQLTGKKPELPGHYYQVGHASIGDVMAFMYNVAKLIYFLYSMRYRLSGFGKSAFLTFDKELLSFWILIAVLNFWSLVNSLFHYMN